MNKFFVQIMFLILCPLLLIAQAPDTLWTRTYGGAAWDLGYSVQQTTDGGYIIVGYTNSFGTGAYDVYLIKTDSSGDTLWIRTYGGTAYEQGSSVQQTTDDGYIIAGTTSSFGAGAYDVYLLKTNSSGDTLWTTTYGGTAYEQGYSVQQTTDGGYIVAGFTNSYGAGMSDVYLIKTDSSGDTLWTKTFGGSSTDIGYSVQQTTDGGYIVAGFTNSYGAGVSDVYLVKTDSSGDTLWTKTHGGVGEDASHSVQQTTDGGYIIAGTTSSFGAGAYDVYLVKTDPAGNTLWTKTFGGLYQDVGHSVQQTTDGGHIIVGITNSFGAGGNDVYLIRTDSSGDTLWTTTYGGSVHDVGLSVQQTTDGGYIIGGWTGWDMGDRDVYLIKTGPEPGVEENQSMRVSDGPFTATIISGLLILPNDKDCKVLDITGRVVAPDKIQPGIYFIEVDGVVTQKVVKVR